MPYKPLPPKKRGRPKKRKLPPASSVRRLKVTSHTVPSQTTWNKVKNVPFIRLAGIWLESAGFKIEDEVEVVTRKHEVVIRPVTSL